DVAVVVAVAHHAGLLAAGVKVAADGLAFGKVHGGARHRQDAPGGAGLLVAFQVGGGEQLQPLVQDRAAAVQVEVGVVGQVDDGVGVRRDPVVHPEGVVRGEGVADRDLHVAGEAVLPVGAVGLQKQGVPKGLDRIGFAGKAAVQMVAAAVGLQLVGL